MLYLMNIIIRIFKTGLPIIAVQFLLSSGCNKNSTTPCVFGGYSFTVSSEWSPQREIYNIGDTLNLTSAFPTTLIDQINTSLSVDYRNSVGIGGSLTIYKFDTILHEVVDAANEFNYNSVIGTIKNSDSKPSRIKDIFYSELSSSYNLKLNVIPKQKGLYAFFISNLLSNGLKGKNCTNAGFSNTLTNTNKNLNLFQYAMGRPPASQYEIDRIYCFRVQ